MVRFSENHWYISRGIRNHFEIVVFFGGVFFENLPLIASSFSSVRSSSASRCGVVGRIIGVGGCRSMARRRRRKCLNCGRLFRPDPRNVHRQKYCSEPPCRKVSKAASQARWLAKPQNRDYFRGPAHTERVRAWRAANPGYCARRRRALQDRSSTQVTDPAGKIGFLTERALQEDCRAQGLVLTGLIATLTGSALQEDIARTRRCYQQLALDIFQGEPPHGAQTPATT